MSSPISKVALIGSFKQHYKVVLESLSAFEKVGLQVTTPKGTRILKHGIPFVRFESDDKKWTNEMVQTVALHRILSADFVFVVVPEGYVGRTTCYEIGRVIQAQRPIYFSQRPDDLPIWIPDTHVYSASQIAKQIQQDVFVPCQLYFDSSDKHCELEQDLLNGQYNDI